MAKSRGNIKNIFFLFLTATIWGTTFVAQSAGMDHIGPFTFNGIRSIVGCLALLPFIPYFAKQYKIDKPSSQKNSDEKKLLLQGGLFCGIALFFGSNLQQIGIMYTTVGKAGFITALYIVIVPLLGIFLRRKIGILVWVGVIFGVLGLYFLCIKESMIFEKEDIFLLLSAFAFAIHILIADHYSKRVDCVKMSCLQLLVCGILSLIVMSFTEAPTWANIWSAKYYILYAGVLSCGIAYTLQIVGQRTVKPAVASLIMSLEAVVAVIAGFIFLHEILSARELFGCLLMFAGIVFAQIPAKQRIK